MDDQTIELRETAPGEFRDYLDGSRVRSGAELLVWVDGQWIAARYEIANFEPREAVLYARDGRSYALDRATMRFRWPRQ